MHAARLKLMFDLAAVDEEASRTTRETCGTDMNVLITSVGRSNRSSRFSAGASGRWLVFAADASTAAPALCEADRRFLIPPCTDPLYVDRLLTSAANARVSSFRGPTASSGGRRSAGAVSRPRHGPGRVRAAILEPGGQGGHQSFPRRPRAPDAEDLDDTRRGKPGIG